MNKQANKQTKKKFHQEQEVPLTNHFQTSMMKIQTSQIQYQETQPITKIQKLQLKIILHKLR